MSIEGQWSVNKKREQKLAIIEKAQIRTLTQIDCLSSVQNHSITALESMYAVAIFHLRSSLKSVRIHFCQSKIKLIFKCRIRWIEHISCDITYHLINKRIPMRFGTRNSSVFFVLLQTPHSILLCLLNLLNCS